MTPHFALATIALLIGVEPVLASRSEAVLHSFSEAEGAYPQASLIADKAGNFYGTTALGGDNDSGVVFVIDPNGVVSVIHPFQGAPGDGANPNSSLARDKDGNLYGTTAEGGSHAGPSGFAPAPGLYGSAPGRSEALAILEGRYARGEIQRDEYLQKKQDLGGG
jgi:uncharacterized repeat protein (TIGR03803 family)